MIKSALFVKKDFIYFLNSVCKNAQLDIIPKTKCVCNVYRIVRLVMNNLVLNVITISFYLKTNVFPNVQIFSILMINYVKIANLTVNHVMINNVISVKKISIFIKISV